MNENCSRDQHDARTCRHCRRLRHPSQSATRRALASLPRQAGPAGTGRNTTGTR